MSQTLIDFDSGEKIFPNITQSKKLLLVIVADIRCGYCGYMRRAVFADSLEKIVDMRILEFGPEADTRKVYNKIKNRFDVRLVNPKTCSQKLVKFFPRFFLYDAQKRKVIYSLKGFIPRRYSRLKRKIHRRI